MLMPNDAVRPKTRLIHLIGLALFPLFALGGCSDSDDDDVQDVVIRFEDVQLSASGYRNGSNGVDTLTLDGATFHTEFDTTWESWSGVAFSKLTDDTTAGYTNQFSAYAGSGAENSEVFLIASAPMSGAHLITFANPTALKGIDVTNTTYAALSMKNGDAFAKKFNVEDEDYFVVTFTGYNANDEETKSVDFYLADFRSGSSTGIVDSWTWVDLTSLGSVSAVDISFASSDVGTYGINTPLYVALDNLTIIGE